MLYPLLAYLIGSIASSLIVSKIMGLPDPRTLGSGNAGATNMARVSNKKIAVIVLAMDVFKGVVVALMVSQLSPMLIWSSYILVVVGHIFPVFFGFRGGKGVATYLGVVMVSSTFLGLATLATWIVTFAISRYSSLAAIIACSFVPLLSWLLQGNIALSIVFAGISLIVILAHLENIKRLIAKTELNPSS